MMNKNICLLLFIFLSLKSTTQEFIEAVSAGDIDKVHSFLARNMSPLFVDNLGRSSLIIALENHDPNMVRTLINSHNGEHKSRLLAFSDGFNNKPLHVAARFAGRDLLDDLYYIGFDIDSQNDNDDTPLHIAARNGNLEAARFFLEKGADINIYNQSEFTPIDSARRHQGFDSEIYIYLNNLPQNIELSSIGSADSEDSFLSDDITDMGRFENFVVSNMTLLNLNVEENLENLRVKFNNAINEKGFATIAEIIGWIDSLDDHVEVESRNNPDDDEVAILYGASLPYIVRRETARKGMELRLADGSIAKKVSNSLSKAFSDWFKEGFDARTFNDLLAEGDTIYFPSDEVDEVLVPQDDALDYLRLQVQGFDDLELDTDQINLISTDLIKGSDLSNLVKLLNKW